MRNEYPAEYPGAQVNWYPDALDRTAPNGIPYPSSGYGVPQTAPNGVLPDYSRPPTMPNGVSFPSSGSWVPPPTAPNGIPYPDPGGFGKPFESFPGLNSRSPMESMPAYGAMDSMPSHAMESMPMRGGSPMDSVPMHGGRSPMDSMPAPGRPNSGTFGALQGYLGSEYGRPNKLVQSHSFFTNAAAEGFPIGGQPGSQPSSPLRPGPSAGAGSAAAGMLIVNVDTALDLTPADGFGAHYYCATGHYVGEPEEEVRHRYTQVVKANGSSTDTKKENCVLHKRISVPYNSRQQFVMVDILDCTDQLDDGTFIGQATLPLADPRLSSTAPWPLIRDGVQTGVVTLNVQIPSAESQPRPSPTGSSAARRLPAAGREAPPSPQAPRSQQQRPASVYGPPPQQFSPPRPSSPHRQQSLGSVYGPPPPMESGVWGGSAAIPPAAPSPPHDPRFAPGLHLCHDGLSGGPVMGTQSLNPTVSFPAQAPPPMGSFPAVAPSASRNEFTPTIPPLAAPMSPPPKIDLGFSGGFNPDFFNLGSGSGSYIAPPLPNLLQNKPDFFNLGSGGGGSYIAPPLFTAGGSSSSCAPAFNIPPLPSHLGSKSWTPEPNFFGATPSCSSMLPQRPNFPAAGCLSGAGGNVPGMPGNLLGGANAFGSGVGRGLFGATPQQPAPARRNSADAAPNSYVPQGYGATNFGSTAATPGLYAGANALGIGSQPLAGPGTAWLASNGATWGAGSATNSHIQRGQSGGFGSGIASPMRTGQVGYAMQGFSPMRC